MTAIADEEKRERVEGGTGEHTVRRELGSWEINFRATKRQDNVI